MLISTPPRSLVALLLLLQALLLLALLLRQGGVQIGGSGKHQVEYQHYKRDVDAQEGYQHKLAQVALGPRQARQQRVELRPPAVYGLLF